MGKIVIIVGFSMKLCLTICCRLIFLNLITKPKGRVKADFTSIDWKTLLLKVIQK
jgi:hypothetical protein